MTLLVVFALLIAYVLIFCVVFTLDYSVPIGAVRLLSACRAALLVAVSCYLVTIRNELVACVDPLAACVVAILAVGAVSGLFEEKSWFVYFRHGFQYVFLLSLYLAGRAVGARLIPEFALKVTSAAILLGYAVATAIYVETPGLHSGSYSFQPNLALLPIAYGVSIGQLVMTTAGSILVIVGNKRAVYIGLAILFAAALALRMNPRGTLVARCITVVLAAPVIGVALGALVSQTSSLAGLSSYTPVVNRFSVEPTFNAGKEATVAQETKVDPIVRFTSARSVEVAVVWTTIAVSPAGALFGHGLGTVFTVKYVSPNDYEVVQFEREQADLAPVHVALTSGLPLAAVFTGLFGVMLLMVFARIDDVSAVDRALALFSIATAVDTMLGFNPTNPICWMALGVVSRRLLPEFSLAYQLKLWRLAHHA